MYIVFRMSVSILGYPRMLKDTLNLGFRTSGYVYCIWDVNKHVRILRMFKLRTGIWLIILCLGYL